MLTGLRDMSTSGKAGAFWPTCGPPPGGKSCAREVSTTPSSARARPTAIRYFSLDFMLGQRRINVILNLGLRERAVVDSHLVDVPVEILAVGSVAANSQRVG